jgi:hypothetical protein
VTRLTLSAVVGGLLFAAAMPAAAKEIRLSLAVEPPVIREALMREVFTDPDKRADFWGTPVECSFFYLRDPEVEGQVDRLRIVARGEARLGADLGATCLSPLAWGGFVEVFERPRIDGWKLRFEVVDSNLLDEKRQKTTLVAKLWDRMKESVQPRFAAVTVDVGGPFRELREFLPTVVPPSRADEARRAVDSLRPVAVRALPKGIVVEAAFDVAEAPSTPAPAATEAPLSEAELAAFTERANQWDAFLTFVIKNLGSRTLSKSARQALLDTLIDARYQITEALSSPSRQEDPIRQLFLKGWERLRPVADDIARELPGAEAAQVLTFLAAGDALAVLDQAGPSFGIEISADGLRRMARMIAPGAGGDPLEYSPDVDPTLRRLLGFGAPISVPDTPESEPTASRAGRMLAMLFGSASAWAAQTERSRDWRNWVVDDEPDLSVYLARVHGLLGRVENDLVEREKLSAADADLFRKLVTATAWQESCWRQFRKQGEKVTYLRSSRGSVGMLQVNERAWRGFYEMEGLRWKIAYNAGAGAEIVLHYWDLAKEEATGSKKSDALARATYAGYNGGPMQLRRYLDAKTRSPGVARVVDLFAEKFAAVGDGVETKVASCLAGGPA